MTLQHMFINLITAVGALKLFDKSPGNQVGTIMHVVVFGKFLNWTSALDEFSFTQH